MGTMGLEEHPGQPPAPSENWRIQTREMCSIFGNLVLSTI